MSTNYQPAFPTTVNRGMYLRDYFAAKVLPVMYEEFINNEDSYADFDEIADHAYRLADAMMTAREQT